MHADEVFLARHLQLHRRARFLREHDRDQVGVLVLILVAEVAAHVQTDDSDLLVGDSQITGDVVAAVDDAARWCVHGQLVALPRRNRRARLHLRVVVEHGGVAILEDVVSGAESSLDVAALHAGRQRLVANVQTEVALRPDLNGAGLQRLLGIEDELEDFVIDRDQMQGFLGKVTIGGGDRRDRLPDVPHRIVEGVAALLRDLFHLVVVLHAAGNRARAPDDHAVLVREHRLDAGQRLGFRDVDRSDARMRMRAAKNARVQHARQLDVA